MTIPNASSPLAVGLRHLWSEDTGNTDLVNDQAWTLVGTLPPVVSTPFGNARRGNGVGHLTFGARPDLFADGTSQATSLAVVQIIDSTSGGENTFLGKTVPTFVWQSSVNLNGQRFYSGVRSGLTTTFPILSAVGGLADYNGKMVAVLTVYDGANTTLSVRILEQGQPVLSNSVATYDRHRKQGNAPDRCRCCRCTC